MFVILFLAYSTQHNTFELHVCCKMHQRLRPMTKMSPVMFPQPTMYNFGMQVKIKIYILHRLTDFLQKNMLKS